MILLSYEHKIKETLTLFDSLANPLRLKIFRLLLEKDLCVCELQMLLKVEQSRLSHQLRLLRLAGLIEAKEEGRWSVYTISPIWKEHALTFALKKSLPLGESEKKALAEVSQRSPRLKGTYLIERQ